MPASNPLSVKQLRHAAREARKLAMECVEGTAELGAHYYSFSGPVCNIGTIARRTNLSWGLLRETDIGLDVLLSNACFALTNEERQSESVFVLLSWADTLDKQADAREAEEPSRGRSAP